MAHTNTTQCLQTAKTKMRQNILGKKPPTFRIAATKIIYFLMGSR